MSNPKVALVQALYDEIEAKIQKFKAATQLDCVVGCGECCNRFEPYITVLEGLVVADCLQKNSALSARFFNRPEVELRGEILCPFYMVDTPYHCGIYSIRPFICRMYSFSGKEKDGCVEFQPCQKIQQHFASQTQRSQILIQEGLALPIYAEEYQKLCQIDFILATDFHPLTRSIELALKEADAIQSGFYQNRQKDCDPKSFSKFIRNHLLAQQMIKP